MADKLDGHFDDLHVKAPSECEASNALRAECYSQGSTTTSTEVAMAHKAADFADGIEKHLQNGGAAADLSKSVEGLSPSDIPDMARAMNRALKEQGLGDKLFVSGSSDGVIKLMRQDITRENTETAHGSFYGPGEELSFDDKPVDKEALKEPVANFAESLRASVDNAGDLIVLRQLIASSKEIGANPGDLPSAVNKVLKDSDIPYYLQAASDGEVKLFRKKTSVSTQELLSHKIDSSD